MNKKIASLVLSLVVGAALLAGCSSKPASSTTSTTTADSSSAKINPETDAVTGASQINGEDAFEKAIAADSKCYMVIVNKDLTFTKDLTVESGTRPGANGAAATPNRSIAPAVEDSNQKISKRYTITVPNLIFKGDNEKVEYGIVKGDVYVQGNGFTLKDATIEGNLYFATQALKDAFKQDATTKITGTIDVKTYTAQ